MSLEQLVAHFNRPFHQVERGLASLILEENAVVATFHGIRLESRAIALYRHNKLI